MGTNSGGQSTGRVLQHIPVVQEAELSSPLPPGSCPTPNNCGPKGQRNERSIVKCPTQPLVSCTPATHPPPIPCIVLPPTPRDRSKYCGRDLLIWGFAKGRAHKGPFFVRADLWQTPSAEDLEELNFHLEGGSVHDGEPFCLVLLLPSLPNSTWAEWTKKWVVQGRGAHLAYLPRMKGRLFLGPSETWQYHDLESWDLNIFESGANPLSPLVPLPLPLPLT